MPFHSLSIHWKRVVLNKILLAVKSKRRGLIWESTTTRRIVPVGPTCRLVLVHASWEKWVLASCLPGATASPKGPTNSGHSSCIVSFQPLWAPHTHALMAEPLLFYLFLASQLALLPPKFPILPPFFYFHMPQLYFTLLELLFIINSSGILH